MGWGTDFTTDVYLSRLVFTNKYQVEDKIKEKEKEIADIKQKLSMFITATPNTIVPTDWNEDPIDWLNMKFNELFEELEELNFSLFRLDLYNQYLEDNNITTIKKENTEE